MDKITEYPEYEISTFRDFEKIPEDKLDQCLEDFKLFIKQFIEIKNDIISATELVAGLSPEIADDFDVARWCHDDITVDKFIWIDDGKHETTKVIKFIERGNENADDYFLTVTYDGNGMATTVLPDTPEDEV